jgi:hypothetical protein
MICGVLSHWTQPLRRSPSPDQRWSAVLGNYGHVAFVVTVGALWPHASEGPVRKSKNLITGCRGLVAARVEMELDLKVF